MNKIVTSSIEILGKQYPIRCHEAELKALQLAAAYLNEKMLEIRDSGKVINLERIAIISGLNIAHQFLTLQDKKNNAVEKINQKIIEMQNKIDIAFDTSLQTEFAYSLE